MPYVQPLRGGVANAGAVARVDDDVVRPAQPWTPTVHDLLRHIRASGFEGVPEPVGIEGGRERLKFIEGQVPHSPYPPWTFSDQALTSTAVLLRRLHDTTASYVPPPGATWNPEQADPEGGDVICHDDFRPDNVVFRDGRAFALLDFDFAAPGRRAFDVAGFTIGFLPCEAPQDAARLAGRDRPDACARFRLLADSYGALVDWTEVIEIVAQRIDRELAFLEADGGVSDVELVARGGHKGYVERARRRREWFGQNRDRLLDALA